MCEYMVYVSRIQRKYAMTVGITRTLGSINYLVVSSEPCDLDVATKLKDDLERLYEKYRKPSGYFFCNKRDIEITKAFKRLQPSPPSPT